MLTTQDFLSYIRAFNARDYNKQVAFYHENVKMIYPDPTMEPQVGREAIKAHYKALHQSFTEKIVPIELMLQGNRIFFIMEVFFHALKPVEDGIGQVSYQAGDISKVTSWALYEVKDGLIESIHCSLISFTFLGKQDDLLSLIKESQSKARAELHVYQ